MVTVTISCDPGVSYSAFAVYKNDDFQACYKIKTNFNDIIDFFKEFEQEEFELVIEGQYLNLNPKTLIQLVTARVMIATLAKVAGAKNCKVINPQTWQRTILGTNIQAKREQRKRVSKMVAKEVVGKTISDVDIADAICIGEYATRIRIIDSIHLVDGTNNDNEISKKKRR